MQALLLVSALTLHLPLVCLLTHRAAEAQTHVRAAEEAKFQVNPELKRQIRDALSKTPARF
jgi:hypothetical protein